MLLYHSFPRVIDNTMTRKESMTVEREIEIGLEVLDSIFANGLLLTSEEFPIPTEAPDLSSRTLKRSPRRACFTALSRSEIVDHSKLFGSFSIGLNAIAARLLGVMPTIYVYGVTNQNGSHLNDITDGGVPM